MSKKEYQVIRAAVIAAMKARGWSAERLAKESGVGRDAVYRFIAGKRDMKAKNVEALFAALGITMTL